jgi:hypothetical protein
MLGVTACAFRQWMRWQVREAAAAAATEAMRAAGAEAYPGAGVEAVERQSFAYLGAACAALPALHARLMGWVHRRAPHMLMTDTSLACHGDAYALSRHPNACTGP